MNKLPSKLKRKLIQINDTARKVSELSEEFIDMIQNEYGLDPDLFINCNDTEEAIVPFINIVNSGDIYDDEQFEKDVKDIERVFLLHINKKEDKVRG